MRWITAHRLAVAATAAALASSCRSASPLAHQSCADADARLAGVMRPLEAARENGCDPARTRDAIDCDHLRRELARLALVCPGHPPTLMANAVVAYDEHQPVIAQQYLDQLLAQSDRFPDAAVLRARIALEEGNLPYARRLLEQQIRLVPDHAGLRETYGAALFLGGQLVEARRELTAASALGAPRWRIAYHLGLIEEAAGRFDEARRYYTEALEMNPGWAQAEARLKALRPPGPRPVPDPIR